MSDFMWPPENVNIRIVADISEELISIQDYIEESELPNASIPAVDLLLYKDLKFTFNEWRDLIRGLRSLTRTELLIMESDYIESHPEEFEDE